MKISIWQFWKFQMIAMMIVNAVLFTFRVIDGPDAWHNQVILLIGLALMIGIHLNYQKLK